MTAGRKPKPTHLKVIAGNPGKRALNKREPKPRPGVPTRPAGLSARAVKAWDEVAPMLHEMGVLTSADGMALAQCCEAYADLQAARAALKKRKALTYDSISSTGGKMVRSYPEAGLISDADRRFRAWLVEFGLTPSARSKVTTMAPEVDPADAFFG